MIAPKTNTSTPVGISPERFYTESEISAHWNIDAERMARLRKLLLDSWNSMFSKICICNREVVADGESWLNCVRVINEENFKQRAQSRKKPAGVEA